jgi:UDP-glucose 4,6-dehydratase
VKDVVSAFDTIIHKGEVGNTYNIGTDNEKSIKEVVTDLVHLMKGEDADPSKYMNFVEDRLFNDLRYAVDSKKLISLGWKPKQDWLEGLKHTIEWYKKNAGNWDNLSSALVAHPRLNGKESFSK